MCISGLEKACLELWNTVRSKICFWQVLWMPRASVSASVSPPWGCWPSFCECFKVLSKWISCCLWSSVVYSLKVPDAQAALLRPTKMPNLQGIPEQVPHCWVLPYRQCLLSITAGGNAAHDTWLETSGRAGARHRPQHTRLAERWYVTLIWTTSSRASGWSAICVHYLKR